MLETGTPGHSTAKVDEFSIVERVAYIASSVYGAKPDYTRLASELAGAISFDVFGIVLLQHDHKAVRVTVCQRDSASEESQRWLAHYHQHPFTDSMLQRMMSETSLLISDYPLGLDGPPAVSGDALSNYPQLRATCIVPLRTKERLLGTLELGSVSPANYANAQVQRLIRAVAQVLAAAVERTQLEGSAEIQNRQRQALKDVSRALTSSTMELTTILSHITDGVAKALGVSSIILTLDSRSAKLQLAAQSGLDETVLRSIFNEQFVLTDECIIGNTIHHRQSYTSNDIEHDERFPSSRVLTSQLSIHSVLSYPLAIDNAIYGTLLLCSTEVGGFTPLKADIVALFATQATLAIHNARLLEAASQRSRFQHAIEQLEQSLSARKLSKAKEFALFTRIREETQRTFGVSLTSILRFVGENLLTSSDTDMRQLRQDDVHVTQSADALLERTGIVSELSALLMQVQPSTKGIKDAWLVTDLQGRCIYMNPVAETLCHVMLSDIEKMPMPLEAVFTSLLAHIGNTNEVRGYLQDFASDNLCVQELRCSVASDIHYLLTRHALHNQQGQLTAYALQVRDITSQVRDERNKAALLSSVSHDLRTPLTTIKAAVTGLLQTDIPWDEHMRREMLEDIDAETDHLTVLVSALVEMSRIEMGALILEKEWCDINEVVYETLTKAKRTLATRGVNMQSQGALPRLFIDRVQIGRVLYNLLENAARQSPEGSEICIDVDVVKNTRPMVRVRIADERDNVLIDEQEHVFTAGAQAQSSGLGLAICKGIVEMHHGSIWVEPTEKGACCNFTLPTETLAV